MVRQAVNLALDRNAYVRGVRQNGAVTGAALMPKPLGFWGLPDAELRTLAGYRDPAKDKAEAKRLLAGAGHGPDKPLRVDLVTRTLPIYLDLASYVVDQLRLIGMEATIKQLDTAAWFPALSRRDFQIGANLTAGGFDDPDAYLFENYKCGSPRNYTDYCSEEMDRLIDQQSQELDRTKRLKLGGRHPAQAQGRRGAPDAGLAQGILRALAPREEPRPAQRAVQLRADAGGVAGQVEPWTSASSTPRSTRSATSPTPRTSATRTAGSPTAR